MIAQIEAVGRAQISPYDPVKKASEADRRRANPSEAERVVAAALSKHGVRFRREEPIEGYVVDFYLPAAKLVIEVDGSHHQRQRERDKRRDDLLKANRYSVLRVAASDVLRDPETVIARLDLTKIYSRQNGWGATKKPKVTEEQKRAVRQSVLKKPNGRLSKRAGRDTEPKTQPAQAGSTRPAKHSMKRKFQCTGCSRSFVAAVEPWPACRSCASSACHVQCRRCEGLLPGRATERLCVACLRQERDIRESRIGGASSWWRSGRHTRGT